ncbi:hypothetical protein HZA33_04875 [Candidatus Pacearchaeota archaeon]|nr:hypothetical protein [Candidatus Pacearchaeota archaeon]
MTTQKAKNAPVEAKPVIVRLKPGTAAEKSMKFQLPKEKLGSSVEEIVTYALGLGEDDGIKREDLRIAERVKKEMAGKYGISINGEAVDGKKARIRDYLQERASKETKFQYLEAQIIVAARQEGANSLVYRL